ncbi:hypothetical protein QAD02_018446 [Eretmocerus hayati]|uniref:Uncharacterized protein n=1 Tax=Eretmocerus hayati TaxID=131215 RepID=A0ACC2PJ73_9HYME|nr:hypothetical protein QAD02_018446 [Eretmocerus hayati]
MTSNKSDPVYLIVDIFGDVEEDSGNENILTSTIISEKCVLKKIDTDTAYIFYAPNSSGEMIDIGYVLLDNDEPIPKSWIMYRAHIIMRCGKNHLPKTYKYYSDYKYTIFLGDMGTAKYFIVDRDILDQYMKDNPIINFVDNVIIVYDEDVQTIKGIEENTDTVPNADDCTAYQY